MEILTEKEWGRFFELLDKIVNHGAPYGDKKAAVAEEARNAGSDGSLDEFVGWFAE